MKRITVIFSKGRGFAPLSKAIIVVENSTFSHVCFRYTDERTGQTMVFESSHGEVHEMLYEAWLESNSPVKFIELEISDHKYYSLLFLFNQYKQTNYGYMQILGIALFYMFGTKRNIFRNGDNGFFCSELVAYLLDLLKIVEIREPMELVGPKRLYEILTKQTWCN